MEARESPREGNERPGKYGGETRAAFSDGL